MIDLHIQIISIIRVSDETLIILDLLIFPISGGHSALDPHPHYFVQGTGLFFRVYFLQL